MRPSTRWPGCSGCPSPAVRTSTARPATATRRTSRFPRGLTSGRDLERHRFDFSFSGLKTAVARWVEQREADGEPVPVADVAASFQEAVVDVLTRKAVLACREQGVDHLLIGGGVAANSRLRVGRRGALRRRGHPGPGAAAGAVHGQRRDGRGPRFAGGRARAAGRPALDLPADSSLPVTTVSV